MSFDYSFLVCFVVVIGCNLVRYIQVDMYRVDYSLIPGLLAVLIPVCIAVHTATLVV